MGLFDRRTPFIPSHFPSGYTAPSNPHLTLISATLRNLEPARTDVTCPHWGCQYAFSSRVHWDSQPLDRMPPGLTHRLHHGWKFEPSPPKTESVGGLDPARNRPGNTTRFCLHSSLSECVARTDLTEADVQRTPNRRVVYYGTRLASHICLIAV